MFNQNTMRDDDNMNPRERIFSDEQPKGADSRFRSGNDYRPALFIEFKRQGLIDE